MNEEFAQDELLFDRLVDGELDAAERRRLLESLDARPDGWRRCALAFLEAQAWRDDLRRMVRTAATPAVGQELRPASGAVDRRRIWKRSAAALALAASLFVAFLLGSLRHGGTLAPEQFAQHDGSTNGAVSATAPGAMNAPKSDDAVTLWVLDEGGKTRPVRVPLVDASHLDRSLGLAFQPSLPAAVRDRLAQQGYAVQSKQRYAPLWLEDGQPMVLPVEDMRIVPVSY